MVAHISKQRYSPAFGYVMLVAVIFMARKFNNREISGNVKVESNGQHMKANWFCVNCNCIGSYEKHYPDCNKKESYAIPSTGEVPKKDASKKKWDVFKKQFVYAKPVGWWFYYEYSWWAKNNCH